MMVLELNDTNFAEEVLKSDKVVVVDFFATWCPPCQRLSPVFDAVANELPEIKMVKVNIDDAHALAAEYGINSIPTFIVFKNGSVVAKEHPRSFDQATLKRQIQSYLNL